MLDKARELSRQLHEGQTYKIPATGLSYFFGHVVPVAAIVRGLGGDEAAEMVAYLHDVLEDTPCTADDLRHHRFNEDIIAAVEALTHDEGSESHDEYLERIKSHPLAIIVKYADSTHNMTVTLASRHLIDEATFNRRMEKYRHNLTVLQPMLHAEPLSV